MRSFLLPSISLTNTFPLSLIIDCFSQVCAWIASNYWVYFDPIGAVTVSIYIATTWFFTGKEHLAMLSGKSAEPEFINRIVKVIYFPVLIIP